MLEYQAAACEKKEDGGGSGKDIYRAIGDGAGGRKQRKCCIKKIAQLY